MFWQEERNGGAGLLVFVAGGQGMKARTLKLSPEGQPTCQADDGN